MPLRSKIKSAGHAAGKMIRGRKAEPRTAAELVLLFAYVSEHPQEFGSIA
jgi:hypothetical protein